MTLYTVAFLVWLVMIHTTRYNEEAKRCSGDYLTGAEKAALPNDSNAYLLTEGKVVQCVIIGMWCANSFISVCFWTCEVAIRVSLRRKQKQQ